MSTTETKVTHTPGPWRVTSDTNRELPNMVVSEEKGTVAHLVSFVKYRQADANVIAAAPDLYRTLNELFAAVELLKSDLIGNLITADNYEALMKPAYAALRKANGETSSYRMGQQATKGGR